MELINTLAIGAGKKARQFGVSKVAQSGFADSDALAEDAIVILRESKRLPALPLQLHLCR
jgi:hypothetical protein